MERARIKREWNGSPLTDIDMMIQSAVVAPLAEYTGVAEASGDVKTTKEQVLSSLGI
jgi:hypothetical protein